MKLSVIIPALQEAMRIGACLDDLASRREIAEVIVVDGGSSDGTVNIARARDAHVIESERGRGHQQNLGAAAAIGDVLLFLHVDVRLPVDAIATVKRILAGPGVVAGAFRTWTVSDRDPPSRLAPLLHLADMRSRYTKLPYGDQALFVRAATFRAVGGFPEIPLMEDLELSRRLSRLGRITIAPTSVRVSGRRFESAPIKQTFWVNAFPALFALGVPVEYLARLYGNPR